MQIFMQDALYTSIGFISAVLQVQLQEQGCILSVQMQVIMLTARHHGCATGCSVFSLISAASLTHAHAVCSFHSPCTKTMHAFT